MNTIQSAATFEELPGDVRVRVRRLLDAAPYASPFQDPIFCGHGLLGGTRSFHAATANADFYAFCTTNFAASRYLPFLRALIVHKGPIAENYEAFENGIASLKRWARHRRYLRLSMSPQYPQDESGWLDPCARRNGFSRIERAILEGTLLLDLQRSEDEIFAGLKKETRYEVRRALRSGVSVRQAASRVDAETFYELYNRRGLEKGFGIVERSIFLNLADRILADTQRGALFLSEVSHSVVSGVFVLRAGPGVHYVYGAIDDQRARSLPVGYPALWEAILWAKKAGASEFNFGGYSTAGDPAVRRFKKGFGGTEVQFVPGLECSLWNPLSFVV